MKTKLKFCLPIIKSSIAEVEAMIRQNPEYDYFEVWLDYIEDLSIPFLQKLHRKNPGKLSLLFRRQNLEKPKLSWERKKEILDTLNGTDILFDFDIYSQKKELDYVLKQKINIKKILSYHNYKMTPDNKTLYGIFQKMKKYNPSVYKASTFCVKDTDAVRLMGILLNLKSKNVNYIVLGMGEKGMITRVYGAIMGNFMNFAPKTLKEKSAPGQLSLDQLQNLHLILNEEIN